MTQERFKEFMDAQIKAIEEYKWIESEKEGHDLGNECCIEWVMKFAKQFREDYRLFLHCYTKETFGEWLKNPKWDNYREKYRGAI